MKNSFYKCLNIATLTVSLLSTSPILMISCDIKKDVDLLHFKMIVNKPWNGSKNDEYFNQLIKDIKQNNKNLKFDFNVSYILDNVDIASAIKAKKANMAFITSTLLKNSLLKNDVIPLIQTKTRAFYFDKLDEKYVDGSGNDPLRKIAKIANDLFNKKPYKSWTDNEYQWNGKIYEKFYDKEGVNVNYQRGSIMIFGTDSEIKSIKKAWENKDWNAFRNFGIVIGKKSSGTKYIAQEDLFKKHFNLANNKFSSFANDQINNVNKYITEKPRNIGKGALSKYHIVFDEFASFAYTHNWNKSKSINYNFYCPDGNKKIELLTVTDPIKFNVLVVDKSIPKSAYLAFANSIINLAKEKKDTYGPNIGFNEYELINESDYSKYF